MACRAAPVVAGCPLRRLAAWLPVWSLPAAMRAVRATLVMPGLFALTSLIIGDPQMTLFAVFGSFATLVLVSFGGTRRDKALAHLGLAITCSVVLVIGTCSPRRAGRSACCASRMWRLAAR